MIVVNNLTKYYKVGINKVTALDNVTLKIDDGEFVAVVGESGAGKSTLFHILAGLEEASSGEVIINGKNILKLKKDEVTKLRRNEIGLIYQFYNLVPILNIEENIVLPSRLNGEKTDNSKLEEILNKLNLFDRRYHLPNQLSGGEQQRTAIARVIYSSPSIILADEPTGNLDQKNSDEIIDYFVKINREKKQTVLLITHSYNVAKKAKRIITMSDGKIISDEVASEDIDQACL